MKLLPAPEDTKAEIPRCANHQGTTLGKAEAALPHSPLQARYLGRFRDRSISSKETPTGLTYFCRDRRRRTRPSEKDVLHCLS